MLFQLLKLAQRFSAGSDCPTAKAVGYLQKKGRLLEMMLPEKRCHRLEDAGSKSLGLWDLTFCAGTYFQEAMTSR